MEIRGKSVYAGVAIGKAETFSKNTVVVTQKEISDIEAERARLKKACEKAKADLMDLYEKVKTEVGESGAEIFMSHQMMLEDPEFVGAIDAAIAAKGLNAEYAVSLIRDQYLAAFGAMDDEFMKARVADISDVSDRLTNALLGNNNATILSDEPIVLFADDLTPSETASLDTEKILAFVTRKGSENSHTAILARTYAIPALVACDYPNDVAGKLVIVDGETGSLICEPTEAQITYYKEIEKSEAERKLVLLSYQGKKTITKDGKEIKLYANIASAEDAQAAVANDAEGIGLYRTELDYLRAKSMPSEDDLYQSYLAVAKAMGDKPVILRTIDIGADKQASYFDLEKEENPAMGYRAIRICLDQPEILKKQLSAIYRAAAFGNFMVMFPMITSVKEIQKLKDIVREVLAELDARGLAVKELPIGIMIETPAAALVSADLAKEVDFFSIGTNDLTQYTLAADRQNEKIAHYYDAKHPAVEALIRMTIENAHKAGIWAGICGELAADEEYVKKLVDMGVDELSVAPSSVLKIRAKISE